MNRMLWMSFCSTALATLIAYVMIILQHPDHRDSPILFLVILRGLKIRAYFWERNEAPLPPLGPNATSSIYDSSVPFLNAWNCRFQMMKSCAATKILSPQEQIILPRGSRWTPHEVLVHHMVDVQKATADFREASERRPATSSQTNRVSKLFSNRSPVQKRLSIYNWNPGPRRGKENAFDRQIAGRWHVITLQEASEYVDHDILTGRFHVTHYAGCAILFYKDTFHTNIDVKSIHLHDTRRDLPDQVMEESKNGPCKVYFHVPHFVDHQSAAR